MSHDLYKITVSFVVCDGMRDKVLEEIRDLTQHIEKNALDHASNKKIKVTHEPATEEDLH